MLTMGTALSQQVDANWQTYIMIANWHLLFDTNRYWLLRLQASNW